MFPGKGKNVSKGMACDPAQGWRQHTGVHIKRLSEMALIQIE